MRVADYIINYIYDHGTDYIFTIAGGGAMFLNDAVVCHKKIKYISNHHEQASAMAAEAYAKVKNQIGAVMVTSGPGSTNTITGLLEAWQNSIPVIFISSQAKKSQMIPFSGLPSLRQFGIQEVDIIPIIRKITKYSAIIEKPEKVKFHLDKAYFEALSGRPGPVWLDIPLDVANSIINTKDLTGFKKRSPPKNSYQINNYQLDQVFKLIKKAKKPVIIAGGGIKLSKAHKEFNILVNLLKIPVVVSDMGIGLLTFDSPYYAGHGGTKGDRAANIVIQNSDLILSIGSRLAIPFIGHEYRLFAPGAKKIIVDIDRYEHAKKTIKFDHLVISDAKYFINELIKKIKSNNISHQTNWLTKCQTIKKQYSLYQPDSRSNTEINMYQAVNQLSLLSKPGDIFITDAGITAYVCTQTIKIKQNQKLIIPGATLTMGYNLPAITGTWAADKKSRIICITGDGSFQMNIHELAVIAHHKIPAKIFILNNRGYLAIRTTQKNYFKNRLIGESKETGVQFPDTGKIAAAYGIKFIQIKNYKELTTIKRALDYKGTVICEINTSRWQDHLMVSSKKLRTGQMISLPIDNMYPFLSNEAMRRIRKDFEE